MPFRVLAAIARGIVTVVKSAFDTVTLLLAVLVVLVVAAIAVAIGLGIADGLLGLHSVAPFMRKHHALRILAQIVGGLAGLFVAFLIVLAKKRSSSSAQSPVKRGAPQVPQGRPSRTCPRCAGHKWENCPNHGYPTCYLCRGGRITCRICDGTGIVPG